MPVRQLRPDSDAKEVSKEIIKAHPSLLAPHLVSGLQVERLVARLIEHKHQQQQLDATAQRKHGGVAPPPSQPTAVVRPDASPGKPRAKSAGEPSGTSEQAEPTPPDLRGAAEGGDLNAASETDLKAAKAAMELTFSRHALRPGDAGYLHDKRVEAPAEVMQYALSLPLPWRWSSTGARSECQNHPRPVCPPCCRAGREQRMGRRARRL